MPIDKNINLDLPIDAYDAEGNLKEKPENVLDEGSTKVSQTEEKKEVEDKKDEEDEQRVPYSRFSSVRERAEKAEREAEEARDLLRSALSQREVPRETPSHSSYEEGYAREVKRLYGDTPVAEEIIELNLKHQRDIEERAERRAIEAVQRVKETETRILSNNESVIESRLEHLSDKLGRQLSEREEAALLEIVDEYTPTGDDGKYAGEILPFDKAWEIYELKQEKAAQTTKRSRSSAVAASGSQSQGEPSGNTAEQDKAWNPRNWKSLYDRIGKN